jgi:hypothetical protein
MNDELVCAPRVVRFTFWPRCFACGEGTRSLRALWALMFHGAHFTHQNARFCPGHKPPTETQERIHPFGGLVGMPDAIVKREAHWNCAGIERPHLHIDCRQCHASWLMECRER